MEHSWSYQPFNMLQLRDELYAILQILSSDELELTWNKEKRCIEGGEADWADYLK